MEILELAAEVIDFVAVCLLLAGIVMATILALRECFWSEGSWAERLSGSFLITFRITLGRWLLAGLEALIVSDVLHSIYRRTLEEIGILGAIVAIRTALAYFLDHEITRVEERDEAARKQQESAK
ncbi:DUF1622 domain-containing protein [Nisaea acidiphila]|uniref:DUF1622 domain-containing protein n=1 Tax=Nisaea acidiphila TaxID=1862145 RepID=A0A9J7ALR9_9PROT|nr:DUF1622 domain-containing protein [Nisaea acidiphila]UUX48102.1 DUF1622 domain-containing protein [Nisaea acidiphila]